MGRRNFTLIQFEGVDRVLRTHLHIAVHTQKNQFGFVKKDEWSDTWHVHVTSVPQHNRANAELEKECTRLFGVQVKIMKGHSSSKKVLDIPLSAEAIELILSNFLENQANNVRGHRKPGFR